MRALPSEPTSVSPNIIHSQWYSHGEHIFRRVDIYLPEGYCCDSDYTTLYLIHGINGYEGSWEDVGHVADTMEALVAQGLCKPMIIVMPDCNKWPFKERPVSHGNLWKCLFHYSHLSHEHEIEHSISDLMDMMDTVYQVSSYYAIAGLSDGARMAANAANNRPDRFRTVGLFSPVLHKDQLPKDSTQTYYIYAGTSDIFYGYGKRFHKRMNKAGYPHAFLRLRGNHNWKMWRMCLSHFLQQIGTTADSSLSEDGPNSRSDSENHCTSF